MRACRVCRRPAARAAAAAAGLSQEDLMIKDECILVDEQDRIVGHANKYTSHRRVVAAGAGGWAGSQGRQAHPCG